MLAALGISARIYTGFAIVLALLGVLAVSTYMTMGGLEATFDTYRGTARNSLYLAQKQDYLSGARLAVLKYTLFNRDEDAATARDGLGKVAQLAVEAPDRFDSADVLALARTSGSLVQDYQATFEKLAAASLRSEKMKQDFQKLGNELYTALAALSETAEKAAFHETVAAADRLNLQVQRARLRATIFLTSGDTAELDLAKERVGFLREANTRLMDGVRDPLLLDQARKVTPLLDRFAASIEEMRVVMGARAEAFDSIVMVTGPKLGTTIDSIVTKVTDEQNTLGPKASAAMESGKLMAQLLGIGAIALGLVLAFVIGRWIAGAVQGMANSMSRMAGGDLDITVTGDQYRHELGAMAKALKVFQQNGREKLRLDAEARAAAERDAAAARERAALQDAVQGVVEKAAAGDFAARVETRWKDDSLNAFAKLLNSLIEAVASGVTETAKVMEALARGDLTTTMEGEYRGAFAELKRNVNATVSRLSQTVMEIQSSAGAIATATGQIASGAQNLSSRAENQAASLEEIAATMEEMSATVKTNAENAFAASSLSTEASGRADKGGAIVAEAVTAMAQIEEGSRKIADIVTVIDGFAFQTNLLALNAAVEAARAGEAGKGFAVVASEVRTLAQRSAEAARDIKNLIQESSHQVADGVRLVEETGIALKEIVEAIKKVSGTITEISEASREQSSGVDEITAAITSMDEITQQNSALADESASAAKGLTEQAGNLSELMRFFTIDGRGRSRGGSAWDADAAADAAAARASRKTIAAE